MGKHQRKRLGKVDRLPEPEKDVVEQMLLEGIPYREIVEYLRIRGHVMSAQAVCNFARKYLAEVNKLRIAQENFRMMMEELDKHPNLDTTEGIIRILSGQVFSAIANQDEKAWEEIELEQLLRQTTALIRAASYKKRTDTMNQSDFESGLEAAKKLVFEALAKDRPDLYKEVSKYLSEQKAHPMEADSV